MALIFAYGSLMKGLWNEWLLETSEFITPGITEEKYLLTVSDQTIPKVSQRKQAYQIVGELYKVNSSVLEELDNHEGNGDVYFRTPIKVLGNDGCLYTADIYLNPSDDGEDLENGDYRKYVLKAKNK